MNETKLLIEQAASAFRHRDPSGRIMPSPAWWDIPPEARDALFQQQPESRILERAVDPEGLIAPSMLLWPAWGFGEIIRVLLRLRRPARVRNGSGRDSQTGQNPLLERQPEPNDYE